MSEDNHQSIKTNLELITHEEDFSDFMDAFESDRNLTPTAMDAIRKKRDKARARKGLKKHNLKSYKPPAFIVSLRKQLSDYEKTDAARKPITLPSLDRLYTILDEETSNLIKKRLELYRNEEIE